MSWIWAALMPHPPIIVPEVGRGREREAAATLEGTRKLLENLSALPGGGRPEALLILSPHQPYVEGGLFLNTARELSGDLGRFGASNVSFKLKTSDRLDDLARHIAAAGLPAASGEVDNLTPDHGSQVPLYFLRRILTNLPPVIVANPIGLTPAQAIKLGRTLAGFSDPASWALLASGDLSHRLTRDAPAGYNPEGQLFDHDVMAALGSGAPEELPAAWPPSRLAQAGECGFRSALTLMGLAGGPAEVLSYEGPFGVGYGCALWTAPRRGNTPPQRQ